MSVVNHRYPGQKSAANIANFLEITIMPTASLYGKLDCPPLLYYYLALHCTFSRRRASDAPAAPLTAPGSRLASFSQLPFVQLLPSLLGPGIGQGRRGLEANAVDAGTVVVWVGQGVDQVSRDLAVLPRKSCWRRRGRPRARARM